MQLFEMCDKKTWHGARLRAITRQRCAKHPLNGTVKCVFFLNTAAFQGVSGKTHGVNIKKSQ